MHLVNIFLILCSVTSSVLTKPYGYSYYLSLPGHYQSLEVRDGAVTINNVPQLAVNPGSQIGPGLRQGRVDPAFNPNPGVNGPFPVGNPDFRQDGFYPAVNQSPDFGRQFPTSPGNRIGPDYRGAGLNPAFNQNPAFGRRFPGNQNGPDFRRGSEDPDNRDIPDGELDPQFNQGGRFPGSLNRPAFGNGLENPNNLEFDPQFNQRSPNSPEFGSRMQPLIPRRRGISRRTPKPQDIDESDNKDKEEVTTQQPCSFCGVDKVNPKVGIDTDNVNPDSEPVDPKNIGGRSDPGYVIQNNLVTPASVSVPGYSVSSPFFTYYVVSTL